MKKFQNDISVPELFGEIIDLARSYKLDVNSDFRVDIMDGLELYLDDLFHCDDWSFEDLLTIKEAELILDIFTNKFEVIAERLKRVINNDY